jgi:flagellar protein FlaF
VYKKELDAYIKVEKVGITPRETEARVLTKGAMKLRECVDIWDSDNRKKMLSEALRYNQRIWSIFQADLTSGNSPLPDDLRTNLLRLSVLVDKQIFMVTAHPSPEILAPIIDVNLGIAAGLRKKPAIQPMEMNQKVVSRGFEIKG